MLRRLVVLAAVQLRLHHVHLGFLYTLIVGHSLLRLLPAHCVVLGITLLVAHAKVWALLLVLIEHH